ncbi:APC family permease [Aciditerrimonas ferrireducens]|jgi:amino acid transporter|uniref:APC family permease n=1 Tax=Aciditerrimonas ferrireducens TaxID=667306 RepID=A0ABV6C3C8_9ACTN
MAETQVQTAGTGGTGEMKRTLSLTGVTVNGMALIAPGAFLWTTFQEQAAQTNHGVPTGHDMWTGLFFAFVLAMLTAWSYSQLARIYPEAGTGSSYYFAEAAFLDKEKPQHQAYARWAKFVFGWMSHLYYWIYPGIMIAFIGTLVGYIVQEISGTQLGWGPLSLICVASALLVGYIAYRGISGSTLTALVINVIQIVTLVGMTIIFFIAFRIGHPHAGYVQANAGAVLLPHNFVNLLYQSTIAILLLVGFESITALGAEAKNPERDIQRGVLISLLIQGGFCYLFEYFGANFALGTVTMAGQKGANAFVAAGNDSAPIGTMVQNAADKMFGGGGEAAALLVAFTVLMALVGTTLACVNTGVRVSYAMAKDKELPSVIGWLHGRFATPHGGILVMTVLSALIGVYGVHTVDNLTQITLASNIGTFLVYGMTCLICVVAFASRHDKHTVKHLVLPGLGLVMNVAELIGVVYLAIAGGGSGATDAIKAIIVVAIWAVAGVVWFKANPNREHAHRITFQERRQQRKAQPAGTSLT